MRKRVSSCNQKVSNGDEFKNSIFKMPRQLLLQCFGLISVQVKLIPANSCGLNFPKYTHLTQMDLFDGWRERVKAVQSHLFKCIHCLLWVVVITGVQRTCSCKCWTIMCLWWLWHLLSTMLDGWCWAPLPPQARKTDWALASIETTYMYMYTDGDHVDTYHNGFNLHFVLAYPQVSVAWQQHLRMSDTLQMVAPIGIRTCDLLITSPPLHHWAIQLLVLRCTQYTYKERSQQPRELLCLVI